MLIPATPRVVGCVDRRPLLSLLRLVLAARPSLRTRGIPTVAYRDSIRQPCLGGGRGHTLLLGRRTDLATWDNRGG